MTRAPLPLAALPVAAFLMALSGPAFAQALAPTGGASNTGVTTPSMKPDDDLRGTDRPSRPTPNVVGNPSPSAIPGSTPGVNIGGTPTGGPPGTGGAAGGPSLGNR